MNKNIENIQRIPLFHDLTLNNGKYDDDDDDDDKIKYMYSHNHHKKNR